MSENNEEVTTQENPQDTETENHEEVTTEAESEDEESEDEYEDDSSAESNEEDEESDEPVEKKKRSRNKRRLDKLRRAASEAKLDAEYWKNKALGGDDSQTPATPAKKDNDQKPTEDEFDSHADYIEALTDWKVDQKLTKQKEADEKSKAKQSQSERATAWQGKVSNFQDSTPDFDEVMENVEDVSLSQAATDAILDSDIGPNVLYHIAKNPEIAEKLSEMKPIAAIKEIGRIESELSAPSKKEVKKQTKAPAPLKTVKRGGKSTVNLNDPNLSQAEFEAVREKQLASRAG